MRNGDLVTSLRQMAWNICGAYGAAFFWVLLVITLVPAAILPSSGGTRFPDLSVTIYWLKVIPATHALLKANPEVAVFMSLIFAPVVEEAIFRMLPLTFVAGRRPDKVRAVVIVICGIAFGLAHRHPMAVFIQGAVGFMLGWLYLRNSQSQLSSYLSCVLVHFMYNFTVIALSV